MKQEEFVRNLLERSKDYSVAEANFLFAELGHKTDAAKNAIFKWISTGEKTVLHAGDWTTADFEKKYAMNYIAATLTVDWLMREPDIALNALKRGLK